MVTKGRVVSDGVGRGAHHDRCSTSIPSVVPSLIGRGKIFSKIFTVIDDTSHHHGEKFTKYFSLYD